MTPRCEFIYSQEEPDSMTSQCGQPARRFGPYGGKFAQADGSPSSYELCGRHESWLTAVGLPRRLSLDQDDRGTAA